MQQSGHLMWWSSRRAKDWPMLVEERSRRLDDHSCYVYLLVQEMPVHCMEEAWLKIQAFDSSAERFGPVVAPPRRVIIESPFSGDVERNQRYLDTCLRDSISRGEAPFASHRMYTGVLNDAVAEERELGLRLGFAWRASASLTAVYQDLGLSGGMDEGIADAKAILQQVEYRKIGWTE